MLADIATKCGYDACETIEKLPNTGGDSLVQVVFGIGGMLIGSVLVVLFAKRDAAKENADV